MSGFYSPPLEPGNHGGGWGEQVEDKGLGPAAEQHGLPLATAATQLQEMAIDKVGVFVLLGHKKTEVKKCSKIVGHAFWKKRSANRLRVNGYLWIKKKKKKESL